MPRPDSPLVCVTARLTPCLRHGETHPLSASRRDSPLVCVAVAFLPGRRRHVVAQLAVYVLPGYPLLVSGALLVLLLQAPAVAALAQVRQDLRQLVDDDVVGSERGGRLSNERADERAGVRFRINNAV